MKKTLLFLSTAFIFTVAGAQTPTLINDIEPGAASSYPLAFGTYAGQLYFRSTTTGAGYELYRHSGSGPAVLVHDIYPGAGNGVNNFHAFARELGGKLYFPGNNGATGNELMVYDGTGAPALAGAEIRPGASNSSPVYLTVLGGKLYFSAADAATGNELWVHDPATASNTRLTDLMPGTSPSLPRALVVYNNKLYFSAISPGVGAELHCYDPSTNATTLVADIYAGGGSAEPHGLTEAGGKLYFVASTFATGQELYVYDGTSSPLRVTDLAPGAGSGVAIYSYMLPGLVAFGGKIYFAGRTVAYGGLHLYAYDPSSATTALVQTLDSSAPAAGTNMPFGLTEYSGKLYFSGSDGVNGYELWATDGITTTRLTDLNPGAGNSIAADKFVWNNRLYFSADDGTTGYEFYSITATAAITALSFDGEATLYPNPASSTATLALTLRSAATIGVTLTDAAGRMVWTSAAQGLSLGKNDVVIPMAGLPAGQYFYRAAGTDGRVLVSGAVIRE